ncbi:MAG: hypothetical protein ACI9W7_001721 [Porticoccaceae bacterium]|jgi:hypothetical protein|tara:strand:+ start:379 stop:1581 length:1203 start_codon:yes stop_codon:yes gene_type:complete
MRSKIKINAVMAALLLTSAAGADSLADTIGASKIDGNFRSYFNTRDYDVKTDESALSVGGALRVNTGSINGFNLGLGFYAAQDLGTNSSDAAKVNKRLGSELEVLGEAYVNYTAGDTSVTVGRQKLNTPFANSGDAFIIPFSFEGTSIVYKGISNVILEVDYINSIKNRNSSTFTDVGAWTANRFSAESSDSDSTIILGGTYTKDALKVQAWYYDFDNMFNSTYLQANYALSAVGSTKPFVAVQYGTQGESGDEILGEIKSSLLGIRAGIGFAQSKLTLAYNTVSEESGAFKSGAFLAPYSYSTSPLFTNNMLQTFENVDSGDAVKVTFNHSFAKVKLKASYAEFDFDTSTDREAIDFDLTYDMSGYSKGLTLRYRIEVVTSDVKSVEQINQRFQMQYRF